jgi:hypothetical protein
LVSCSRNSYFTQPGTFITVFTNPPTGPYLGPDESGSRPPTYFFKIRLNIIVMSTPVFTVVTSGFTIKTCMHFYSLPCMLHALPISPPSICLFYNIWLGVQITKLGWPQSRSGRCREEKTLVLPGIEPRPSPLYRLLFIPTIIRNT